MSLRGLTGPLPARTGRLLHAQLPPRAVGEQGQQGDIQGRIRRARQKLCPFLRDGGCPSAWGLPWASTASAWVSSSWPKTNRLCLLVGCSGYSCCGRAYTRVIGHHVLHIFFAAASVGPGCAQRQVEWKDELNRAKVMWEKPPSPPCGQYRSKATPQSSSPGRPQTSAE